MTTSDDMSTKTVQDYLSDDSAQSTTEYILIIGLISVPIWVAFKVVLDRFLVRYIKKVVQSFSRG